MAKPRIRFYPVGNGDMTLIVLSDGTTILIDCNIRDCAEDSNGVIVYDVVADLRKLLRIIDGVAHVDLFILTHPDEDHCRGFLKHFFVGDPVDYSDKDKENGLIVVDELYATALLFENATCEDAKGLKREANRRLMRYTAENEATMEAGNRLRLIGYNDDLRYEEVPNSVPGETITKINGSTKTTFELFVHSPFKQSLITASAEADKNFSSIVMQARFKVSADDSEFSEFFLFGGDADHYVWAEILAKSKKYNNLDKLKWNYFLAPHHCSWTFFNDCIDGTNDAQETSLAILDQRADGGKILASCKPIKDDDINPPHHDAKLTYLKKLPSSKYFIELATEDCDPEPVEFRVEGVKIPVAEFSVAAAAMQSIRARAQEAKPPYGY